MQSVLKIWIVAILALVGAFTAFADESEEMEFEPIHATIAPGSSRLKFEDVYDGKSSITVNGDALIFNVAKGKYIVTDLVTLPVNARQDYTLEFTFRVVSGDALLGITCGNALLSFGEKVAIYGTSDYQQTNKKWKTPKGEVKGQYVCKIVRKKNDTSFFLNDKYVGEVNFKPQSPVLMLRIVVSAMKKSTVELTSVRIDQGPED